MENEEIIDEMEIKTGDQKFSSFEMKKIQMYEKQLK